MVQTTLSAGEVYWCTGAGRHGHPGAAPGRRLTFELLHVEADGGDDVGVLLLLRLEVVQQGGLPCNPGCYGGPKEKCQYKWACFTRARTRENKNRSKKAGNLSSFTT